MKFHSKGLISLDINGEIYSYKLYQSLESLSKTKSQRKTKKELNISHTVFNRRLLKAEEKLGFKITEKVGNGTILTRDGLDLLEEFQKYIIKIESTNYYITQYGEMNALQKIIYSIAKVWINTKLLLIKIIG